MFTPDPYREELYTPLGRVMEKYGEKYFILGVTVCTIFEAACRGMDQLLMDMIENEEKANYVLDIPFHFSLRGG